MSVRFILLLAFALTFIPRPVHADDFSDRQIEQEADFSRNFQVVLGGRVHAYVKDGVVTLTGVVRNQDDRSLAEDTVNELPGVRGVNDQIRIDPRLGGRSDASIAFHAKLALLFHAGLSSLRIHVAVQDGTVTLTGTAGSAAQRLQAEAIVRDVKGVRAVLDQIAEAASPPPPAPRAPDGRDY